MDYFYHGGMKRSECGYCSDPVWNLMDHFKMNLDMQDIQKSMVIQMVSMGHQQKTERIEKVVDIVVVLIGTRDHQLMTYKMGL